MPFLLLAPTSQPTTDIATALPHPKTKPFCKWFHQKHQHLDGLSSFLGQAVLEAMVPATKGHGDFPAEHRLHHITTIIKDGAIATTVEKSAPRSNWHWQAFNKAV